MSKRELRETREGRKARTTRDKGLRVAKKNQKARQRVEEGLRLRKSREPGGNGGEKNQKSWLAVEGRVKASSFDHIKPQLRTKGNGFPLWSCL